MAKADVCLILEGSYPYVSGGVSGWTHDMIQSQSHLNFSILSLMPRDEDAPEMKYDLPDNVVAFETVRLQHLPQGKSLTEKQTRRLLGPLTPVLRRMTTGRADLQDFKTIVDNFSKHLDDLGEASLLNSQEAFELLSELYEQDFEQSSFLDYFWSWRALLAGLFSLVRFKLPEANAYHAISTGYAGLLAARAKLETGKPTFITEHGIYTNERRIEIATAEWLTETASKALTIDQTRIDLRDFWTSAFANYSRIGYEAADEIITLFGDNRTAQSADGAPEEKLRIIPNGIDVEEFDRLNKTLDESRPCIALIGRVVPVKDIKAFIRTVAILKERLPSLEAYIMGPRDEDKAYAEECDMLADHLGLNGTLTFTGKVDVRDYLPRMHVVALTSISEAQPLVVLEAGAAKTPVVSTDVGACREMILGAEWEEQPLGQGGIIVPPANPSAMAKALFELLTDQMLRENYAENLSKRVHTYYHKADQHAAYRELYHSYID